MCQRIVIFLIVVVSMMIYKPTFAEWKESPLVDEFGDEIGTTIIGDVVKGTYSNLEINAGKLTVRVSLGVYDEAKDEKFGFAFEVLENNNIPVAFDEEAYLKYKIDDDINQADIGYDKEMGRVSICSEINLDVPQKEDLTIAEALSQGKEVKFIIYSGISKYNFTLDAVGFAELYKPKMYECIKKLAEKLEPGDSRLPRYSIAMETLGDYKDAVELTEKYSDLENYIKYEAAESLMEKGDYNGAIVAFEELNGYKDSKQKLEDCREIINGKYYKAGIDLMGVGDYEGAITAFKSANGYKDSVLKIRECQAVKSEHAYETGIALMDESDYESALVIFKELNDYKDSFIKVQDCVTGIKDKSYNAGVALMDEGDYESAFTTFKELNDYKDSVIKMQECTTAIQDQTYNMGIALMDEEDFDGALSKFVSVEGYKDASAKVQECKNAIQDREYNLGVSL